MIALDKKTVRGTLVMAGSTYFSDAISLVRSIILARLLIPEYFGIVALASFFFSLFKQLKEFNLDIALIHKSDASSDTFSTHFVLRTGFALINLLVVIIISPILLKFYGLDIVRIILIFSFFSLFQEASQTPRVYLEKELLFGRVAVINITKEILKTAIPIIMAIRGFGIWSLVAMGALDMVIPFLGYIITKTWKISFRFSKATAVWFLKFSAPMWLGGLCMMLMFEFDNFLVGTMVGAVALGFYVKAYEFSKLPTQMITHIITRVSIPVYSKLKEDKEELSRSFNNFLYVIVRCALPFSLLLFIIAPEFINLFLGGKWAGSILLLRLLVVYSVLRAANDDCGALLFAVGKPKIVTRVILVQAVLMVILGPFFVHFLGVRGAAIFVDFMVTVGILLIYKKVSLFVDIEYKKDFFAPVLSAIIGLLTVFVFFNTTPVSGLVNRLIIKSLIFLGAYAIILAMLTGKELKSRLDYVVKLLR